MELKGRRLVKRSGYFWSMLVLCVATYELPYALTLAKTGWSRIPPIFDFDQMLYLNLSAVRHLAPAVVENPWYGDAVSVTDIPHLMFPVAFLLFAFFHAICRSWMGAMLTWIGIWTGLMYVAAVFCLRALFPQSKPWFWAFMGFGLLVGRSPLTYVSFAAQIFRQPTSFSLTLPYIRFAFPQIIVPLILMYVGLQALALKDGRWTYLAGMAVLQLLALAAYPYVVLLMALGTAVALALVVFDRQKTDVRVTVLQAVLLGLVCAGLDLSYVTFAGFWHGHGNLHFSFQLNRALILPSLRPYMLLLVAGGLLALRARAPIETRTTVTGLAVANAILGMSDVVMPYDAQMILHINYLVDLTILLPLLVFVWSHLEVKDGSALRAVLALLICLVALWGGYSSYRSFIDVNMFEAKAERQLAQLNLTADDLVIGPNRTPDDVSAWVPLMSNARVLFTIDAENMLSMDKVRSEQNFRQAVYLRLCGIDLAGLLSLTSERSPDYKLNMVTQHGERGYLRSPLSAQHSLVRAIVRQRLIPEFQEIEVNPKAVDELLGRYRRVIILEASERPVFGRSEMAGWLRTTTEYDKEGVTILIGASRR